MADLNTDPGFCYTCWGQSSASFGYGQCPECGGRQELETKMEELNAELTDTEKELEHRETLLDELETKFKALETSTAELTSEVECLRATLSQVNSGRQTH